MACALITGGSSGIGEATALSLAIPSNTVFITGRSEKRLKQVKQEIELKGATCEYHVGDVRKKEDVDTIFSKAINTMGQIDVLVANAGVGRFKLLEELTEEDYDIQFDVNVKGVFLFLRLVVKHMKQRGSGQIIVTSSNLGFTTSAKASLYAATKFALQGMIGSLRQELKGTGVKAATINPGSVDTPWFDGKNVDRSTMLDVKEVAEAILFIINQGPRSNIDHMLLHPALR